ncbi:hypothetical protein H311_02724 [Anncaliia algerae PRA109]|nr:hypothetical protein H311_02724 [Anncaliia algerae PRA109]
MDETVLNYKCKSHQGCFSRDRTDSLCIVEFKEKIIRSFTCAISNKEPITRIPINTKTSPIIQYFRPRNIEVILDFKILSIRIILYVINTDLQLIKG